MISRPEISSNSQIRRAALRGRSTAASISVALALASQTSQVEAQPSRPTQKPEGCVTGVHFTNAPTGRTLELSQGLVNNPARKSLDEGTNAAKKVENGEATIIVRPPASMVENIGGRLGVKNVQVYDHDSRAYYPNTYDLPCGVVMDIPFRILSQLSTPTLYTVTPLPRATLPTSATQSVTQTATLILTASETPTSIRATGIPAVPSVETPKPVIIQVTSTPIPTAREVTSTPTATVKEVTSTPTPTIKEVTSTPTPTANEVTSTPTQTPHTVYITHTPIIPNRAVENGRDWGNNLLLAGGLIAAAGVTALLVRGLVSRSQEANYIGYSSPDQQNYRRESNRLLENLRAELADHNALRTWVQHERNAMYAVDITAAAAPAVAKVLVGQLLEGVTISKNNLTPNHRRLLNAIRDYREQLAANDATAKAAVEAKKISDQARQGAVLDPLQRVDAFDKTKVAEDLRRAFIAANPDHLLTRFDAEADNAFSVTRRTWRGYS